MKNFTYLILGLLILSFNAEAQVKLDTIYIRSKKVAPSTFKEVRYYYYPNLQAYFDSKIAMYFYKDNQTGQWIKSESLDPNTRGYSLKNGFYVMLEGLTEDNPYTLIADHKQKYPADFSSRPRKPIASIE